MTFEITIHGLVQGVGFRPFIYRLASEMNVYGEVGNCNNGVWIRVNMPSDRLPEWISRIREEKPAVSRIHRIEVSRLDETIPYTVFTIASSRSESEEITQISPDIAVCPECLEDMKRQAHRCEYPFINCTHCGPRFSIIRDLPYDRKHTTMDIFSMCKNCEKEYETPVDRRFHAQPIACNDCGPSYYCIYEGLQITDYHTIRKLTVRLLDDGHVIAVKGIGGYHLVCDAHNPDAVGRLREIKKRDGKPFAVMFGSLEHAERYAYIGDLEKKELLSWRRPIVLLRERGGLVSEINTGLRTLGCMLPYMPLHYHWFEQLHTDALVMTSGNLSDTPIIICTEKAEEELAPEIDFVLHHTRNIHNRTDDSVLQVCCGKTCLIRRSRGYVPEPFFSDVLTDGILAFGAEKVNTFSLGKGDVIVQSQYIGDLKNWETYIFYAESMERFMHLFRFKPSVLVCDLHPDYLSTSEAVKYAVRHDVPLLRVQHHHAHAVACMVEHRLREDVLAVVWDGTGLGTDGNVWGGEFLLCNRTIFRRLAYTDPIPLPGGDKATREPWRTATACLVYYFGEESVFPNTFASRIGKDKIRMIREMIRKKINTPYSSGVGRIFDAVSSLLGFCDTAGFQAEAACRLEQMADDDFNLFYPMETTGESISWKTLFEGILNDIDNRIPVSHISAKFHNTLVELIIVKSIQLMKQYGLEKLVVSGGCFQNKRLLERLMLRAADEHMDLYIPELIPANDSGISVGQLAIAAARRKSDKYKTRT